MVNIPMGRFTFAIDWSRVILEQKNRGDQTGRLDAFLVPDSLKVIDENVRLSNHTDMIPSIKTTLSGH